MFSRFGEECLCGEGNGEGNGRDSGDLTFMPVDTSPSEDLTVDGWTLAPCGDDGGAMPPKDDEVTFSDEETVAASTYRRRRRTESPSIVPSSQEDTESAAIRWRSDSSGHVLLHSIASSYKKETAAPAIFPSLDDADADDPDEFQKIHKVLTSLRQRLATAHAETAAVRATTAGLITQAEEARLEADRAGAAAEQERKVRQAVEATHKTELAFFKMQAETVARSNATAAAADGKAAAREAAASQQIVELESRVAAAETEAQTLRAEAAGLRSQLARVPPPPRRDEDMASLRAALAQGLTLDHPDDGNDDDQPLLPLSSGAPPYGLRPEALPSHSIESCSDEGSDSAVMEFADFTDFDLSVQEPTELLPRYEPHLSEPTTSESAATPSCAAVASELDEFEAYAFEQTQHADETAGGALSVQSGITPGSRISVSAFDDASREETVHALDDLGTTEPLPRQEPYLSEEPAPQVSRVTTEELHSELSTPSSASGFVIEGAAVQPPLKEFGNTCPATSAAIPPLVNGSDYIFDDRPRVEHHRAIENPFATGDVGVSDLAQQVPSSASSPCLAFSTDDSATAAESTTDASALGAERDAGTSRRPDDETSTFAAISMARSAAALPQETAHPLDGFLGMEVAAQSRGQTSAAERAAHAGSDGVGFGWSFGAIDNADADPGLLSFVLGRS